jgi:hypothetical protein
MQLALVRQDIHRMCTLLPSQDVVSSIHQILFLNKIDLFAEKLPRSPLGDYFPDYTGGSDYNSACEYLLQRFVSLNQSAATKQIYAHYTCATDTNQIRCMCFLYSSLQALCLMVFVSRIERDLGYPSTNPFAGMRSFVSEQCRHWDKKQSKTALIRPRRHENGNATMSLYS